MGFIYKITNKENGKIYIGQTTRNVQIRWKEHIRRSRQLNTIHSYYPLYRAMRLHGIDSFSIETIEECDNALLNAQEEFWISYYKSYDRNIGYNMTMGGDGGSTLNHDKIFELWELGYSSGEIAHEINASQSNIVAILKSYNNYSTEEGVLRGQKRIIQKKGKTVNKYDMYGNFIDSFCSAGKAAWSVEHGDANIISKCCRNQKGSHRGFQWRYADSPSPGAYIDLYNGPRKVSQYDLDGNFICTFDSISQASRIIDIDTSCIIRCCQGKQKCAKGYLWKYTT